MSRLLRRMCSPAMRAATDLLAWLHRLDTYTNEEYGRARTLSAIRLECVACGHLTAGREPSGLCRRCIAKLRTDLRDESKVLRFAVAQQAPAGAD